MSIDFKKVHLTFHAENTKKDAFEKFVCEARSKLRDNATDFKMLQGKEYLIVNLEVNQGKNKDSLYLCIRRCDIYLVAVGVPEVKWYEFKCSSTEKKIISGAPDLPFTGSYIDIIRNKDNVTDIKLTKHVFGTVVGGLISEIRSYEKNKKQKGKGMDSQKGKGMDSWRVYILKIIVFVCEAIRFDQIVEFIKRDNIDLKPREEEYMRFVNSMIGSWNSMSASASEYDQQSNGRKPEATPEEKLMVKGIPPRHQNYQQFFTKLTTEPKLCAIILGNGIRCNYLGKDKRKMNDVEVKKKTENRNDSKKKPKTGSSR